MRHFFFSFPRLVLAALLCASFGCSQPRLTPLQAGEQFFAQLSSGEAKAAYESAAFSFQAQQTLDAFQTRLQELRLLGAKAKLSPGAADEDKKMAKLDVEVTTTTGTTTPLILTLQLDGTTWRVYSLKSPRSVETGVSENRFGIVGKPAVLSEGIPERLPDEVALRALVKESMTQFAEAIVKRSFADFYNHTSAAWQSQLTENKLQNAFGAFISKQVDLRPVLTLEPQFDPAPYIGTDGLLLISGSYDSKPYRVFFAFKYLYELPTWKLFGLDVYLRNSDEKAAEAK